jgi:hypothetical protein
MHAFTVYWLKGGRYENKESETIEITYDELKREQLKMLNSLSMGECALT